MVDAVWGRVQARDQTATNGSRHPSSTQSSEDQVLRSLRHYLRAQSQGHDTTDRLEERGVERGSAR